MLCSIRITHRFSGPVNSYETEACDVEKHGIRLRRVEGLENIRFACPADAVNK